MHIDCAWCTSRPVTFDQATVHLTGYFEADDDDVKARHGIGTEAIGSSRLLAWLAGTGNL